MVRLRRTNRTMGTWTVHTPTYPTFLSARDMCGHKQADRTWNQTSSPPHRLLPTAGITVAIVGMFRSSARRYHAVRQTRCRARTSSGRSPRLTSPSTDLTGRLGRIRLALADVLQAQQIIARRLVDVDCPGGCPVSAQPALPSENQLRIAVGSTAGSCIWC